MPRVPRLPTASTTGREEDATIPDDPDREIVGSSSPQRTEGTFHSFYIYNI